VIIFLFGAGVNGFSPPDDPPEICLVVDLDDVALHPYGSTALIYK
jgi:hypothetical protein